MPKNSPSLVPSTGWAVKALRTLGADPASPEVGNGVAYLLSVQSPSGGFPATRGAPDDPENTAYAIMALSGLPGAKDALAKAFGYLGKAQNPDGSYTSAAPMQFKGQPKKSTQGTLFVVWALAEIK
jgi:prenyltransferase beta subunit